MTFSEIISINDALVITGFSMLLVFVALIAISYILSGFKLLAAGQEKKNNNQVSSIGVTREADGPSANLVAEEEDLELIAVITASIAATLQTSTSNIVVRNITRIPQTTPLWGLVSRQQMTNK
ncbi:Oxaloacetate decarboxylase, gamma chain [Proteiniborus ethanoligenes]|uniref:Oxaloacetate decarboxylase, gamma chain n=1 Tax=Proteiniborus ethanoligenes TaxID=415015 RepID=A0A1H3L1Q3_9FIRM|nr:OadG family protein [Proteiniborus ethanoligenes]SDY58149.1 Oxaloacetate decarboxylase, gamma chain [Proteiniborus ethanoligenes]